MHAYIEISVSLVLHNIHLFNLKNTFLVQLWLTHKVVLLCADCVGAHHRCWVCHVKVRQRRQHLGVHVRERLRW